MSPRLNPVDAALKPIDDTYRRLSQRAKQSPVPPQGMVRLSKREARARFLEEWKGMDADKRQAQLQARGVDSIMDLLGGEA